MVKKYNFKKVIRVFRKNYKPIPLESFKGSPYKILISTLLSARTKDDLTLEASKRLFKVAPNIRTLSQLGELKIRDLIYPVGFYRTKAKHLKALAKIVINDFKGNIPATRENLIELPGVGRKTANLVLNRAFGIPAIAVDTHVHRISNLLGWVNTKTPEETERQLLKTLPKKYWVEINKLFVSTGQQYRSKNKLAKFLKEKGLL